MAGLSDFAIKAHEGAGTAGEALGQKAIDLAADKAPASVRDFLDDAVDWCKDHPLTLVAAIVVVETLGGLLLGLAAKTAEQK
jgi:hypothetical protein